MRAVGGLLDRYLGRRFISTYGLVLGGFVLLFLVIDASSKLGEFLDNRAAIEADGQSIWWAIAQFYLTGIPAKFVLVGPFITLFAGIATLIAFQRRSELTPMLAAGRSLHRILLPMYVLAGALVLALVAAEEWVSPVALKRHAAVERRLEGEADEGVDDLPHLRDGPNALVATHWFPRDDRLEGVTALRFVDPSGRLPTGRLRAASLVYRRHPGTGVVGWYPIDGTLEPTRRAADGSSPETLRLPSDEPLPVAFDRDEVAVVASEGEVGLDRSQLSRLLELYPEKHGLAMRLHQMTTRPLSSLILLLLGIPFVARPGAQSLASGLGVALGVCAAYFGVDFFFQELGTRGDLQPLVAAWLAPILFGSLALARLSRYA